MGYRKRFVADFFYTGGNDDLAAEVNLMDKIHGDMGEDHRPVSGVEAGMDQSENIGPGRFKPHRHDGVVDVTEGVGF